MSPPVILQLKDSVEEKLSTDLVCKIRAVWVSFEVGSGSKSQIFRWCKSSFVSERSSYNEVSRYRLLALHTVSDSTVIAVAHPEHCGLTGCDWIITPFENLFEML